MSIKGIIFLSVIVAFAILLIWANLTGDDEQWSEGTGEDDMC